MSKKNFGKWYKNAFPTLNTDRACWSLGVEPQAVKLDDPKPTNEGCFGSIAKGIVWV